MKKLDEQKISVLSDDIFEYTIVNNIGPEDIAKAAGVPVNDVRRLQSENPYVSEISFELVRSYIDSVASLPKFVVESVNTPSFKFFSDGRVESKKSEHQMDDISILNKSRSANSLNIISLFDDNKIIRKNNTSRISGFNVLSSFTPKNTVNKRYAYL